MTSSSKFRPSRRTTFAAGTIAGLLAIAFAGGTSLTAASAVSRTRGAAPPTKQKLLHPQQKYFGVFADGAPSTMAPINGASNSIKSETGKVPNLALWYQAWGSNATSGKANFNTGAAQNACAAGILPMLTWESWVPSKFSQPAFAPTVITSGKYDTYIQNTAKAIAALGPNCPLALRFDQEQNGYWYPWGVTTTGENNDNTPADYVAMWQHVWNIFQTEGATNVLWVWSPNYQGAKNKTLPPLSESYPGTKYVDWVGIDAYYNVSGQTFKALFDPTIDVLKTFASDKPWIVAETGVGSFADKPAEISNLLHAVAVRPRFNGFTYFDEPASRNDWQFQETSASLKAFKDGINGNNSAYASGQPGSF